MDIDAKTEVKSQVLAAVLGITARRIQQLAQDGVVKPHSRGKYYLAEAVQSYVEYRAREKAMSQADIDKQGAEVSIKKAKAIITVLEAKELQGKMHRSEDVKAMTEDLIYTIRNAFMALPGRLAVDVAAATAAAEASDIIRKEVHEAMNELSKYRYDPHKYEERVRERRDWETKNGRDADDEQ